MLKTKTTPQKTVDFGVEEKIRVSQRTLRRTSGPYRSPVAAVVSLSAELSVIEPVVTSRNNF